MAQPWLFLLVLAGGFVVGVLSGMFGIGGASVSNPLLRALGLSDITAIGTTLPSILPSAASGTWRYRRAGLVRPRVVAWTAGAGVVATVLGALLTEAVPGEGLVLSLGIDVLIAFTAFRVSRPPDLERQVPASATHEARRAARPWWKLSIVGVLAGLLSGLLGIGGGVVMVPLFVAWLRLPVKLAVATSLACVGILAVPAMVTHWAQGHIDWAVALPLIVGVIPGAQVGAGFTIRIPEAKLRVFIGVFLGLVAVTDATFNLIELFS